MEQMRADVWSDPDSICPSSDAEQRNALVIDKAHHAAVMPSHLFSGLRFIYSRPLQTQTRQSGLHPHEHNINIHRYGAKHAQPQRHRNPYTDVETQVFVRTNTHTGKHLNAFRSTQVRESLITGTNQELRALPQVSEYFYQFKIRRQIL